MTEKEILKKIHLLKQISPREEWIISTKSQIFGEEEKRGCFYGFVGWIWQKKWGKLAFSSLFSLFLIFGMFHLSQSALPGDVLYPIKKVREKISFVLTAEEEKPVYQLHLVNSRLEELVEAAQTRKGKDLPIVYQEVEASVSEATKILISRAKESKKDLDLSKKVVKQGQKIEKKKKEIEKILATQIETENLEKAMVPYYKTIVEKEIEYWEGHTLKENQKEALERAKKLYAEGEYFQALEILWQNQ